MKQKEAAAEQIIGKNRGGTRQRGGTTRSPVWCGIHERRRSGGLAWKKGWRRGGRGGATAIPGSRSTFAVGVPRIAAKLVRKRFKQSRECDEGPGGVVSPVCLPPSRIPATTVASDVEKERDRVPESEGVVSVTKFAQHRLKRRGRERERDKYIVRSSLLRVTRGQCERLRRAASMRLRRTALKADTHHADSSSSSSSSLLSSSSSSSSSSLSLSLSVISVNARFSPSLPDVCTR